MEKIRNKSIIFMAIFFLFLSSYMVQLRIDYLRKDRQDIESLLYLPSGRFLKPIMLGFDLFVADMLWIKTVGYFGNHLLTDKEYPWLYYMVDIVTDLDPDFTFPYFFGGIILSLDANEIDKSNKILEKGMRNHPDMWQFPFYIGFNYFYHYNRPIDAAGYIERAVKNPDSPGYLKTLPARLYEKGGEKNAGIHFLQEIYKNTEDKTLRERIEKRVREILGKN
ncbi:MAG: tetratricopeptide repeat protein [Nitrospirota bacterium]